MKDKVQAAVLAALGCTTINHRNPSKLDAAAEQIARFVIDAIGETCPDDRLQRAENYIRESIALFKIDPPDTDSQCGFLDALIAVAQEGFGIDLNDAPGPKPGRPRLRLVTTQEPAE